ncbi:MULTISPECIES: cell wall hydrolase [Rhodomicrobium]|uniref:cell wall hydrolase n=1 Tax=Rhodomicrobium sp. R_RK_3 TaxID=2029567 RepID=UPI000B4C1CCA
MGREVVIGLRSATRSAKIVAAATVVSLLGAGSAFIDYALSARHAPRVHGVTIVRVPAPADAPRIALGPQASALFSQHGKQNRADVEGGHAAAPSTASATADEGIEGADKPHFMAAAMTPMEIGSISGMAAETILGQDVNRGGKRDRLSLPQMAVARLLTPADEPEITAGASAALFFVSPPPSGPAETAAFAAPEKSPITATASTDEPSVVAAVTPRRATSAQATWADLVKLARVKGGDGEEKEPSIFGGLTEKEFRARELRCMATAVYFEARGESTKGQIAVAQVIMTRVRSDFYPNTICGVVYQGQWNKNACQFSFACDGVADTPKEKDEWEAALQVAKNVMSGKVYLEEVGDATHYHATYVSPQWRKLVKRVTKIGVHIFYKAPFVNPLVANTELNQL